MGGSADLAGSTKTMISGVPAFQAGEYGGRNMHFGVREHGMAGILNGMALHGGYSLRRHVLGLQRLYARQHASVR